MSKPVSERRYPHKRYHNLPAGIDGLIDQAKREMREDGVEFDNDQYDVAYDPDEQMLVVRVFGTD